MVTVWILVLVFLDSRLVICQKNDSSAEKPELLTGEELLSTFRASEEYNNSNQHVSDDLPREVVVLKGWTYDDNKTSTNQISERNEDASMETKNRTKRHLKKCHLCGLGGFSLKIGLPLISISREATKPCIACNAIIPETATQCPVCGAPQIIQDPCGRNGCNYPPPQQNPCDYGGCGKPSPPVYNPCATGGCGKPPPPPAYRPPPPPPAYHPPPPPAYHPPPPSQQPAYNPCATGGCGQQAYPQQPAHNPCVTGSCGGGPVIITSSFSDSHSGSYTGSWNGR